MESEPEFNPPFTLYGSQLSQSISPVGNTKKQRARSWFFTYNNPDISWSHLSHLLGGFGVVKLVGQRERGESGTEHYQGVVQFKNQITFNTLKNIDHAIHWERCKDLKKAIEYCTKEESRIDGPWAEGWQLPVKPSTIRVQDFYLWQSSVYDWISVEPDTRTIRWIWDSRGNNGKTALAKKLVTEKSALFLSGKGADIKYSIATALSRNLSVKICLFHYVRDQENFISYQALEEVKDGIFFSSKYESTTCVYDSPHVIVLANFRPDTSRLSQDRWKIYQIDDATGGLLEEGTSISYWIR